MRRSAYRLLCPQRLQRIGRGGLPYRARACDRPDASTSITAMTQNASRLLVLLIALLSPPGPASALGDKPGPARPDTPPPEEVLAGVKDGSIPEGVYARYRKLLLEAEVP